MEKYIKLEESKYSYAYDQIDPIITNADEYGVKIQIISSAGKTKWLTLDRDTMKVLNSFI